MIVPEPRRLIGEQSKRCGVRFGKSKFTEGDHLGEHFFGGRFGNAAALRPLAEFVPEAGHQIVRAAPAHRPPQRLRLSSGESRECLADLQHLILIKDHAQRLRKTVAQQGMIDRWLIGTACRVRAALLFAPPHVRVHGAADDRSWPHDCDLDREVLEIARAAATDHLDLRPALDLKQTDGVTGADAIVDRRILEVDTREVGGRPGVTGDQLDALFDE